MVRVGNLPAVWQDAPALQPAVQIHRQHLSMPGRATPAEGAGYTSAGGAAGDGMAGQSAGRGVSRWIIA